MDEKKQRKGCLRIAVRLGCLPIIVLFLVLTALFMGFFSLQLYNRYAVYPKHKELWEKYEATRQPVALKTGWNEYRGVMHAHSEISHDSLVTFPEIVEAMHTAKCQFIFLTDHFVEGKADYSLGWRGIHDGVLFVQGFEMQAGFMPWGLPEDTVFSRDDDPAELAKKIRELGGVLALGHNEAPRPWEIPEIDAMEIYNIHTNMIFSMVNRMGRIETVKDILLNMRAYPDQVFRGMFDITSLILVMQKWDEMSKHRDITPIVANDCHQNVGIRGIYTEQDTLLLIDTGHDDPDKKVKEIPLNFATRSLLRLCFGNLEPGKELFRIDMDPYQRSSRFVNTHLLAKELSEPALLDAVRCGRSFVAFNMIADAEGFAYIAESSGKQVTMGESIPFTPGMKLRAESPLPCQFTVVRNGNYIASQKELSTVYEYEVTQPGKYRIEAALPMPGEITFSGDGASTNMAPWVITNYIKVNDTSETVLVQ
jgi:hypothetical protein